MKTNQAYACMTVAFLAGQASLIVYQSVVFGRVANAQSSSKPTTLSVNELKIVDQNGHVVGAITGNNGTSHVFVSDISVTGGSIAVYNKARPNKPLAIAEMIEPVDGGGAKMTMFRGYNEDSTALTIDASTEGEMISFARMDSVKTGLQFGVSNTGPIAMLVDQKGRQRMAMYLDKDDEPQNVLYSEIGTPKVALSVHDGKGTVDAFK